MKRHLKRGLFIFLAEAALLEGIMAATGALDWHRSVAYPLAGVLDLAVAWFLYLREDNFLGPPMKKVSESYDGSPYAPLPERHEGPAAPRGGEKDPLPYNNALAVAGILCLAAATLFTLLFGSGSRYFL